ncbi:MAG: transglycosylase domain-containing protein [Cyclobacteriaceae bacterium]
MEKPWFRKIVRIVWILFFCWLFGVPIYIYTVSIDLFGMYGGLPDLKAIENPENDFSSEVISADGVSLGRYFVFNRAQVRYEDLSPALVKTLVISEDHRFYEHSGMDFWAYLRVAKGLLMLNPEGGGSTLTQQVAKNLFTQNKELDLNGWIVKDVFKGDYPRRAIEKTKEWIISVHLERNFTKEEIITLYFNTVRFGDVGGIQVAAKTFFNKKASELNIQETAVLIGMLQANSAFNPRINYERSLSKRNEVLDKLLKHGYLKSKKSLDSLCALPIELHYRVQNQNQGLATYFRSAIRPELSAWARENGLDLNTAGLKIYTTIDSRMQQYAEDAVAENMRRLQKEFLSKWGGRNPWIDENRDEIPGFLESRIQQTEIYRDLVKRYGEKSDSVAIALNAKRRMRVFTWRGDRDTVFSPIDSLNYYKKILNAGFMSMDARTGEIRAWVGGINHRYFKYDHVRQGKRQPGSTFKTFVYGAAIDAGFGPCDVRQDISPHIPVPGGEWVPRNAGGDYGTGQSMTLREAMAKSVNSITAQMMMTVTPANVVEFAHSAGIKSELDAVPALCLGVSDVSLYELVGAYGSFVNGGLYTEPRYITHIEDKNGNVLYRAVPKSRQAMSEETAYKIIYMLRGGVEIEGGTSGGIPADLKEDNEIGGKTGTTDNASDGWYMGVTKDLVTGVWVGGDERSIHFFNWADGSGARTARPIFTTFLQKVYADKRLPYKKGYFKMPDKALNLECDAPNDLP